MSDSTRDSLLDILLDVQSGRATVYEGADRVEATRKSDSTPVPVNIMTTQPVVVRLCPGQPMTMPDMTWWCRECAGLTSGRCWRHSVTIWIQHPLVTGPSHG